MKILKQHPREAMEKIIEQMKVEKRRKEAFNQMEKKYRKMKMIGKVSAF